MKNKMIWGMMAFSFLVLLNPSVLRCSEGSDDPQSYWSLFPNQGKGAPCPVDTPRARELWTTAPQTPEAMLLVLKAFMVNPGMSGYELGERLYGLDRDYWGPVEQEISLGPRYGNKKVLGYAPFFKGGGQKGPPAKPWKMFSPPVPYHLGNSMGIGIIENGDLQGMELTGFREGFCVTPDLLRKILGEPTMVGRGASNLGLRYSWDKYSMGIGFYEKKLYRQDLERKAAEILSDARAIDEEFSRFSGVCTSRIMISHQ